jgi:hypothetical protein
MYLNRNSGNVLFLILLAVALFAALSYAVTQSNRSGGNDISDEDARLVASQITQYATLMEQTVTRLRLSNGCRDTQISFAADSDGDGDWYDTGDLYHNPNAPSDFRCHVFHSDGGAINEFNHPIEGQNWSINGNNSIRYIGSPYDGTFCHNAATPSNCAELIFFIPLGNNMNTCMYLNDAVGVDNPAGAPPLNGSWANMSSRFEGAYIGTHIGSIVTNHLSGCSSVHHSLPNSYAYFHVLIPR